MNRRIALFAALLWGALAQAQSTQINNGDLLLLDLEEVPAGQIGISTQFFFETPPGIRSLTVSFRNTQGSRDIDVLLKADEPFSSMDFGEQINNEADYYSAGADGNEAVVLLPSAQPAIGGRTWYVSLAVFDGAASQARLGLEWSFDPPPNVEVDVVFDDCPAEDNLDSAPWNDATAFSPIGGNPATTLGEARRNAMLRAASILSTELTSGVPVSIRACWENLGGDDNSATLASAGPNFVIPNGPGAPLADTYYVQAAAARLGGTEFCRLTGSDCEVEELNIRFNTDVDSDVALGSTRWWYGYNAQASRVDSDFVSVAIHEITHGLGFISLIDENGALFENNAGESSKDAYSSFLIDNTDGAAIPLQSDELTDADRLAAMTSRVNLQWVGAEASVSEANILATSGDGYTRLFAPNPYNGGSSVSHLDAVYCELMGAFNTNCVTSPHRSLGLSRGIMNSVGWAAASNEVPFEGLLFDRGRSGHGFDLEPAGSFDDQGNPVYILLFYSYGPGGQTTEWFLATGVFINGAFQAIRGPEGFGLAKFRYEPDNGGSQPQVRNEQAFGQVGLSFNSPEIHPACNDGTNRSNAPGLAVFTWATGNSFADWCVEPIIQRTQRPSVDFGGLWFSTLEDQGWGFSLANIERDDGSVDLFILLYVYDANGNPAWFQGFAPDFEVGTPITFDMEQLQGYARTQAPVDTVAQAGGTLTLTLVEPVNDIDAGNRIDLSVTIQGGAGGEWVREDVPIQRLSADR